ncbi:hypothetical protein QO200_10895 [Flavobacterium sp. Arc3]|jgi:hypothetical protein|uniref:hypothetical protein n=1 Tax=unclassified Flavobacterium TaxID=196869 RepID=UPI00352E1EBD
MRKIFIFIIIFFATQKSYSCSCTERPSVKVNWEKANEVFIGKIVKIDTLLYGNHGIKIHSYTVEILKSFKQNFYKDKKFRTILSQDEASCDFMFELGTEYLIYAKTDSQTLACSICSRTNTLKNIESSEMQELEKIFQIYKSNRSGVNTIKFENNTSYQVGLVKNSFEEKIKSQKLIIYLLSGIIILLIVVVLIFRKRKS